MSGEPGVKALQTYVRSMNKTGGGRYIPFTYKIRIFGETQSVKVRMPAGAAKDFALRLDPKGLIDNVVKDCSVGCDASLRLGDDVLDGMVRWLTHWQAVFQCLLETEFDKFVDSVRLLSKHAFLAGSYQATLFGPSSLRPQQLVVIHHSAKFAFDALRRGLTMSAFSMEPLEVRRVVVAILPQHTHVPIP
jgi:hypothetical protein|tara:strand:+ start:4097 stop:4666 length:570 start_codon:yes stop_codon:yes gene_type:complete